MIVEFRAHACRYYVDRDGHPSGEQYLFKLALLPLRKLYGATRAAW